jgi:hypothetical protein
MLLFCHAVAAGKSSMQIPKVFEVDSTHARMIETDCCNLDSSGISKDPGLGRPSARIALALVPVVLEQLLQFDCCLVQLVYVALHSLPSTNHALG